MNGSHMLPTVFILRQAMDVIRREALKFDIETGGILIGSRSPDGAVLVTHATPPGPAAIHNAAYFQRDVVYQQTTLNILHRRYGVQYLGEWHKHPRSLPVPSNGDFEGVCELLADPNYGVNELLFPIIICEPDLGFQIHPFYLSKANIKAAFQPMRWHELPLSIEMDRVFEQQEIPEQSRETSTPPSTPCPSQVHFAHVSLSPSKSLSLWTRVERHLPHFSRSSATQSAADGEISEKTEVIRQPTEPVRPEQWYETDEGRRRLAHEQNLLKSFGLVSQPFTIDDTRLCFSFARGGGREIVVICAPDHPEAAPRFLVRDSADDNHRSLDFTTWNPSRDFLVDAVVPMLGPLISLSGQRDQIEGEQK